MRKILVSFVISFGFFSGALVAAEEKILDYQVVAHTTEVHAVPVPGRQGHEVGIAAFRGIAIFDDGEIAGHRYSGGFDFVKGSGRIHGYAIWTFDDKSRLKAEYAGEAKAAPDGGITFAATYTNVHGTGRYAGFHGGGTFAGRRVDTLTGGGDTYFRGTLNLQSGTK